MMEGVYADMSYNVAQSAVRKAFQGVYMVYQPVVSLENFQPIGFEALARTTGTCPDITSLLKLAAAEGSQAETEERICEMALREGRSLIEQGFLLFINMEVSSFLGFLGGAGAQVFQSLGRSVVLEITEHGLLQDRQGMAGAAGRWRETGVRLAVDDVTSGYDRLRYLLRLKPEFVKFDRELVHNCQEDERQRVMMRGLLEMARALGTSVIAEGVETPGELRVLRELGVPAAQGYLFSEPVPADRFPTLWGTLRRAPGNPWR